MKETNKYYIVVSRNGFRWLFPKESHYSEINYGGFMTIKELEDIDRGIIPNQWKYRGN